MGLITLTLIFLSKILTNYSYNYEVIDIKEGLIIFSYQDDQKQYYGLMNKEGKVLYKPKYNNIFFHDNQIFISDSKGLTILNSNDLKNELRFTKVINYKHLIDYEVIKTNDCDYLVNENGAVIQVLDQFDYYIDLSLQGKYNYFMNDRGLVNKDNKYGYIDSSGKTIINPIYNSASYFKDGYATVTSSNSYKIIDINGNIILDDYDYLFFYNTNLILAKKNGKYGYIDINDQVIIDFMYEKIDKLDVDYNHYNHFYVEKDEKFIVAVDKKYGLINKCNEVLIDFDYDQITRFYQSYIVKKDNLFGLFDHNGQMQIEPTYEEILYFKGDLVIAKLNNQYGILSQEGDVVIDFVYDKIDTTGINNRIRVKKGNQYGVIDLNGNIIIDFLYDDIETYSNKNINVKKDNKWAVLDQDGQKLTEFLFTNISDNIVTIDSKKGYINDLGQYDLKYNWIWRLSDDYLLVSNNYTTYGVINLNNEIIIDTKYNRIKYDGTDFVLEKDGSLYLLTKNGELKTLRRKLF